MPTIKDSLPSHTFSRSIFTNLGKLTYRYRGLVIIFWILLVLLSLALTPQLSGALQGTGTIYEAGQAHIAEQTLQRELNINPNALIAVFQSSQESVSRDIEKNIQQVFARLDRISSISSVVSASKRPEYRSQDGHTQYAEINLKVSGTQATASAPQTLLTRGLLLMASI